MLHILHTSRQHYGGQTRSRVAEEGVAALDYRIAPSRTFYALRKSKRHPRTAAIENLSGNKNLHLGHFYLLYFACFIKPRSGCFLFHLPRWLV